MAISTAAQSFELFPTLLAELRLKIWQFALGQRRVSNCTLNLVVLQNIGSGLSDDVYSRSGSRYVTCQKTPALLRTNLEARAEALKVYKKSFGSVVRTVDGVGWNDSEDGSVLENGTLGPLPLGDGSYMDVNGDEDGWMDRAVTVPVEKKNLKEAVTPPTVYFNPATDTVYPICMSMQLDILHDVPDYEVSSIRSLAVMWSYWSDCSYSLVMAIKRRFHSLEELHVIVGDTYTYTEIEMETRFVEKDGKMSQERGQVIRKRGRGIVLKDFEQNAMRQTPGVGCLDTLVQGVKDEFGWCCDVTREPGWEGRGKWVRPKLRVWRALKGDAF
jgi:hypothetical protein